MTPTLYHRLLSDAWHALPDVQKYAHGTDAQFTTSDWMDVTLGRFSGLISNGGPADAPWVRVGGVCDICPLPGPRGASYAAPQPASPS